MGNSAIEGFGYWVIGQFGYEGNMPYGMAGEGALHVQGRNIIAF